ncbi:MAG: heme lyase CcmF/NrfE family subunit [Paracoccaceae bacterium]
MIAELGHFALIFALAAACIQTVVPMVGAWRGWHDWMRVGTLAAFAQFIAVAFAFAALTNAFVTSDFSLALVAGNSHSAKPLIYKITGVWGNHEGSLLLWILILTLFGALVAAFGRNLPPSLRARVLSVQAMIGVAFLGFILFTSNPFSRLVAPPLDGNDLNPLLQDPGLAFHPPFLYLGYVGLSTAFSFAIAALIEGRVDASWARWVRPWTLTAWMFLTIGIAMGSWWAYYELGWGGWWFWDPVENASFMPWLLATALLHSAIVVEKRDALKSWTVLLAILAFSFSLIGAFLVRSGVITSVHAFANDPTRGKYILWILIVAIGGGLTLYAARASSLRSNSAFSTISRESGLVLNNLLLVVATAVVFIGTIWPLVNEALTGAVVSVGEPFFNIVFTPFMVLLAMLLPIGAILPWKRAQLGRNLRPLYGAVALSVALGAAVWAFGTGGRMMGPIGLVLASWIVLGALADFANKVRFRAVPLLESLRRARHLPGADWGRFVAHAGFGLTIFGIAAVTAWEIESNSEMAIGETMPLGAFELRLDAVEDIQGPNYSATRGVFTYSRDGREIGQLLPEKRSYPVQQMPTTEAAITIGLLRDIYVVLGEPQEGGGFAVRAYIKPFVNWIWIGSLIMALGGVISLMDRRYRVAALKSRPARSAVPAE